MDAKQRITAILPSELVREAKHAAIDRGADLSDLVAEGLRLVLAKKPETEEAT